MENIIYITILGLVSLSLVVVVHEFGHFWVARRCRVSVLRFSVGFGKPLFSFEDRYGTEFCVAPIPLGGYVSMVGEGGGGVDIPASLQPYSFANKSVAQRAAIVAAGPLINILFTILVYWGLFMAGMPSTLLLVDGVQPDSPAGRAGVVAGQRVLSVDGKRVDSWRDVKLQLLLRLGDSGVIELGLQAPDAGMEQLAQVQVEHWLSELDERDNLLELLGIMPRVSIPARIGEVMSGSPAQRAGLRPGDLVLYTDYQKISNWTDWVSILQNRPGQEIEMRVLRDDRELQLYVTPEAVPSGGGSVGRIGVALHQDPDSAPGVEFRRRSPLPALGAALERTLDLTLFTMEALGKLVTGALSREHLSGPITIVKVTGEAAEAGWRRWFELMALISLNLGIINLLPIPLLDGGHLGYLGFEALRGRPAPKRLQVWGMLVGALILACIMIFAIYNDLARL